MGINKCLCLDGCTAPMHALHDFVSYVLYINTVTQSIDLYIYIYTHWDGARKFYGRGQKQKLLFFCLVIRIFFFFFFFWQYVMN
jgi:hypothetical protein